MSFYIMHTKCLLKCQSNRTLWFEKCLFLHVKKNESHQIHNWYYIICGWHPLNLMIIYLGLGIGTIFQGRQEHLELGLVEDTPEMTVEPTGATNDEHSSSEWWCWHKAEQNHKRRLILIMHNEQKTGFIFLFNFTFSLI